MQSPASDSSIRLMPWQGAVC